MHYDTFEGFKLAQKLLNRYGSSLAFAYWTAFILFFSNSAYAEKLICVFPQEKGIVSHTSHKYIELLEPKTVINLNKFGEVQKLVSPNCYRFQSIARWQHSLTVECEANEGTRVQISVNLEALKIDKKLVNLNKQISQITGFCLWQ